MVRRGGRLGIDRGKAVWESRFANCKVSEGDKGKAVGTGAGATGQMRLPFE